MTGLWEYLADEVYPNLNMKFKKKLHEEGRGDSGTDFADWVIDQFIS